MSWETQAMSGVRVALVAGGLVVAVVLALKIAVLLLEPRFAFFPPPRSAGPPAALGVPADEIPLQAADGVRLHAWFVAAPGAGRAAARPVTLLAFHGNAEDADRGLPFGRITRAAGFNLMLAEYRGYGRSGGTPSEKGIYLDADAALSHLKGRRDVDADQIVLWGRSIGAAVAVHLAARRDVRGVILESPFTSARDLLRQGGHWPLYAMSLLGTYRFDSAARIGRVRAPILIVHGTHDTIAPFPLARRLFDLAPEPKHFVAVEGGGHNDLWSDHGQQVWDAMHSFLDSLRIEPERL